MAFEPARRILPTNDLLFKKTFVSPESEPILLGFIRDMTGLMIDSVRTEETYHIHNFDLEKLKETNVDVRCSSPTGEVFTIELQQQPHLHFMNRTKFYVYNLYTMQYASAEGSVSYGNLRMAYGINILGWDIIKEGPALFGSQEIYPLLGKSSEELGIDYAKSYYFSISNPNPQTYNIYCWQLFFRGEPLPLSAPAYIHQATEIVRYENLSKEERAMAESISKREQIIQAEKDYVW